MRSREDQRSSLRRGRTGKNAAARKTFYIGKNGKILAIDSAVKTESHGKDIAEKLGALGVAKK